MSEPSITRPRTMPVAFVSHRGIGRWAPLTDADAVPHYEAYPEWEVVRVVEQQSSTEGLPAHLREDAPYVVCSDCGRKSWGGDAVGTLCNMPQPSGEQCAGKFVPPEPPEHQPRAALVATVVATLRGAAAWNP